MRISTTGGREPLSHLLLPSWPLNGRFLGPITGQPPQGLTPDKSRIWQSHDLSADVIHVPTFLVPGLRPVSVKSIQAALRAARTLP